MPSARNRAETPEPAGERQSLAKRLLALPLRMVAAARQKPLLFAVFLCGATVIVSSGVSVTYYLLTRLPSSDRNVTVEAALALLDAGKYAEADRMAVRLSRKLEGDYLRMGNPLFVQGAVLAYEASRPSHTSERETISLIAARYLEESRDRGFPAGREQEGIYLLATSLFNAGNFAESLPVLREAFETLPNQRYELARLTSTACLRDTVPNLKQALFYTRIWLEDPALTALARDEALLQLAEIALGQHDQTACREALSQIDEDSPVHDQALVFQAQLAIQHGDDLVAGSGESGGADGEAKERYREAIEALRRAQSKDEVGTTTRQSRYLLGICHQRLGDLSVAKQAFERARRLHYRTPEALAATLAEAEISQQQGQPDALDLYLKVVKEAGTSSTYRNRWVSLRDLQDRLVLGQAEFTVRQEFESALTMADAFGSVIPADEIAAAKAKTHETSAEKLLQDADGMDSEAAAVVRAEARRQYRLAGEQYRNLAELRFATPEHPSDLWKSGLCFMRGRNYELAIRILREHLENVPRKQTAQGLVGLGECHLALGRHHTAISVLDECIGLFPKHPESYRARILASQAYSESGDLVTARNLLLDNLHKSSLTPRSRHWQESLMACGKLFYRDGVKRETESRKLMRQTIPDKQKAGMEKLKEAHDLFQKAIESLEEMVLREEKTASEQGREPQSSEAQYYIAEAYRHSASLPRKSLEIEPTQTRRNSLRQQMRAYLQESALAHRKLQEHLARKQNQTDLSTVEQRVLRNTYFSYANALFSLEEYDQAVNAYVAATNRYQHEPEALEALMQIAGCYQRMDSPTEARGTLLQAKSVLSRIRPDADFTATTRYSRKEWEQLIGWLSTL